MTGILENQIVIAVFYYPGPWILPFTVWGSDSLRKSKGVTLGKMQKGEGPKWTLPPPATFFLHTADAECAA